MQRQASVQLAHSAQNALAKRLPVVDEVSGRRARRNVGAREIGRLSEISRNGWGHIGIEVAGLWHKLEAPDLTEGGVRARPRQACAAPRGLCRLLREGTV